MTNYGKNFEFRVAPRQGERSGRFYLTGTTDIPIGAPVKYDTDDVENALGLLPVELATSAQAPPKPGLGGILIYEHAPAWLAGHDPYLTTPSDLDTAPHGKAVQVVNGTTVKVVFRNTADHTFLNTRDYLGRVMVAGFGATPTLIVGDYLSPGTGDDTNGYWAESTSGNAWLVITKVDHDRGEVEARMLF